MLFRSLEVVDPLFFRKMDWFVKEAGPDAVLFPQRVEAGPVAGVSRLFVDGAVRPQVTARFQDTGDRPVLMFRGMGSSFFFQRPTNPHCGAHFLKAEQLAKWMKDPEFGVAKADFIGPLESAATLGVMKNFRILNLGLRIRIFWRCVMRGTPILVYWGGGFRWVSVMSERCHDKAGRG